MVEDEFDLGVERIKLIFAGEANSGKSHTAALFVKEFGGLHIDFGKPVQVSNFTTTPKYYDSPKGHAITPCKHVGLTKDQYAFVNKWEIFQRILDNIDTYADSIKRIDDHIPWIIIDDTDGIRGLCAMQCSIDSSHKMPNQNDYKEAAGKMRVILGTLEKRFNVIMCTQMTDKYEKDVNTGIRIPAYYPGNARHIANATLELGYVVKDDITYPCHKVITTKDIWPANRIKIDKIVYKDPFVISPTEMLTQLQFDKAQW